MSEFFFCGKLDEAFFLYIMLIEIDFQFLFTKKMQSNTAVKFLPIYTDEKKVEVSLEDNKAVIKLSTWVEDLGWCAQKTMSLDAEMLDDLHRVIASARYRLNKQNAEETENPNQSKVLAFPNFS